MRHLALAILLTGFSFFFAAGAQAADAPTPYPKFVEGLTPQRGLFTLWRKDGKIYVEIAKNQLDTDFIQTTEPSTGLGGYGVTPGLPYMQFARTMRFSKVDNTIVVTWPNTSFVAPDGSPAARAIAQNFAPSLAATADIATTDPTSGNVVFDASFFLTDIIDMQNYLRQALNTDKDKNPNSAYRLDDKRTYFGPSKAFPENIIIEADQTYASGSPDTIDNVTDPRTIQVSIKYNIAQGPPAGSYTPRIADDRVGYYPNVQLSFESDNVRERQQRYIIRWNLKRHPMVYYISNTIPVAYRDTIKKALLTWNQAFAPIGFPNAVEVKDQPDDPNWDADDIRYCTVHWLTLSNGGGYAQAGLVFDPRTGEMLKTSIVIDANLMYYGNLQGVDFTQPVRSFGPSGSFEAREAAFAAGEHASAVFGLNALRAMGEVSANALPPHYADDFLTSIVLHEAGHDWGLQHNFIASEAYTAKQVQSKAFTSQYGLANSVMEYIPTNVWPKGVSTGDYFQTVLGPYDYYAIKWGYAVIPGATTPTQELPTLHRWASAWSNPLYRFAMDEDVDWATGHAIDPRINQEDLTNDNLAWCTSQMQIGRTLFGMDDQRFRQYGDTHDAMRQAFGYAFYPFRNCARIASHYIGGEYLSRAHIGDPGAALPLTPVSRAQSQRAFAMLNQAVFSDSAWSLSPHLLRQLVYTEWVTDFPLPDWAYNPPVRHDMPIATMIEALQNTQLDYLLNPVLLQRLDDLSLKYTSASTMSLADLFTWMQTAIFGDLRGASTTPIGEIHRNLQQEYARRLAQLVLAPSTDTPYDAQSLARAELVTLRDSLGAALKSGHLDTLTRAHLQSLATVVDQTLSARVVLPVSQPDAGQ
ncbi:MAG TPA: zinc-dependent metalloprotease [Candidatus Eremiobacteraceae bacterium]|nr:zinc-dependent metalloprotease [Candidatus Eremiobacteraceae bacterium]